MRAFGFPTLGLACVFILRETICESYFMRREDYQPRKTPSESPFRNFEVKCLKCGSFKLTVTTQFDEETGAQCVFLICGKCKQQERIAI
jgi:transcription elongation factor Elf1